MTVWKRAEILSLLLATIVVVLTAASSFNGWRESSTDRACDQQSRLILERISQLVELVKDAETDQRGFLLTGNGKYLESYREAIAEIPAATDRLRNNLPPTAITAKLFRAVSNKMATLQLTIDLRNQSLLDPSRGPIVMDSGKQFMDYIRALADRLSKAEYKKLAETSERAEQRTRHAAVVGIGGTALLLGLLIISAFTIDRNSKRREQMISLLEDNDRTLRELNAKAENAESHMRNILESIADGFLSFDRNLVITYINAAAERITGRRKEELIGKIFWSEFSDEDTEEMRSRFDSVMESQVPVSFEFFSAKRQTWWEESLYWAKDGGLSVYFRDITERKRLEERSRNTQKLESLGVLAGGIAHDFNNLLTAIMGGASLLQEELPLGSAMAADHIRIILNASERASQLTRQMLAYSGRGRFVVESVDLSRQIRNFTQLLESSVTRGVDLRMSLDASGFIEADAGQIQQLVINLVCNAAEAIENGPGTVSVTTRLVELDADYVRDNLVGDNIAPGYYVLLEVQDTGKGMDSETQSRIFDPFFTTKFTGRGLGLAAVIGIVRAHHGAIKVFSQPGQGTTFQVFFPLAAAQSLAPVPAPVSAPSSASLQGNETVLVVDDEEAVQMTALAALRKYGYQVLQARNGREALDLFDQHSQVISVVLLDMIMPVMSGEETLRRLRTVAPDVPVVASSGYDEVEALRRFGNGVGGFIQKPYRSHQLAEKIRSALALRSSAVS